MAGFNSILLHGTLFVVLFLIVPYLFTHQVHNQLDIYLFKHKLKQHDNPVFFFVANMYNNEEVLPNWINEFMELANILGTENVFLSIFENDSRDSTSDLLGEFRNLLEQSNIKNKIVTSKGEFIRGNQERITYLTKIRNQGLVPLDDMISDESYGTTEGDVTFRHSFMNNKFSKLVFMNDIYFKAIDIIHLLATAGMEYDIACGLDFYTLFYDHYATRDMNGDWFSDYYPFVRHIPSQELARRGQPFTVYSCWNGGASMNPGPFLQSKLHFRANEPDAECIHSECFLICEDYRLLGYHRIFVNPNVKVTYKSSDYLLHQYLMPISDFFLALFHYPTPTYIAEGGGSLLSNLTVECGIPKKHNK